jgi:diguanylate cyclase (GGDEF)-like protein
MPRLRLRRPTKIFARPGSANSFLPGVLAIVLPVLLLTAASQFLVTRTVERFQTALDRTVGLMVPMMTLHGRIVAAGRAPHAYLALPSPQARDDVHAAVRMVDQLMGEVRRLPVLSSVDRILLEDIASEWRDGRAAALRIADRDGPWPAAELAPVVERLDRMTGRSALHTEQLFDSALRELGREWEQVRGRNRAELGITVLVSVLVLGLAVAAGLGVLRMARSLQASEARFAHLARHDPLTGLENRQSFHVRLEEELERARRFDRPCGLIMLDVDHFKAVNDTHGHPAGDEALRRIAGVLNRCVRRIDHVGRYGGEEFIVLLPETGPEGAEALAERIRAAIRAHPTPLGTELEQRLTASLGVASFPADADSAADLVRAADVALYAAKEAGRDRVARAAGGAAPRV